MVAPDGLVAGLLVDLNMIASGGTISSPKDAITSLENHCKEALDDQLSGIASVLFAVSFASQYMQISLGACFISLRIFILHG